MKRVTLARALSKLGLCSRAQARLRIEGGDVRVGGRVVRDPDAWVDLARDRIEVGGVAAAKAPHGYLAMHKPPGYVTTRSDERGRKTVYELLPPALRALFPIGRLDKDSSGLLLWTNDTRFGERVTSPGVAIEKEYRVRLDRLLAPEHGRALESPLELPDGTRLLPARLGPDPDAREDRSAFTITIVEGKNRQIRRACELLGYEVVRLHRVRVGHLRLGDLPEGAHRALTDAEVAAFGGPGAPTAPDTPRTGRGAPHRRRRTRS